VGSGIDMPMSPMPQVCPLGISNIRTLATSLPIWRRWCNREWGELQRDICDIGAGVADPAGFSPLPFITEAFFK
jgi:hypothetical protein